MSKATANIVRDLGAEASAKAEAGIKATAALAELFADSADADTVTADKVRAVTEAREAGVSIVAIRSAIATAIESRGKSSSVPSSARFSAYTKAGKAARELSVWNDDAAVARLDTLASNASKADWLAALERIGTAPVAERAEAIASEAKAASAVKAPADKAEGTGEPKSKAETLAARVETYCGVFGKIAEMLPSLSDADAARLSEAAAVMFAAMGSDAIARREAAEAAEAESLSAEAEAELAELAALAGE